MSDQRLLAFERLLDILNELREKCPWDREQTITSLRNLTIEETYELADAIIDMDYDQIRQELGDLMLHIVFYAKIAEDQEKFNITDVLNTINEKLLFRHPHVFGEAKATTHKEVKELWEERKLEERNRKRGVLDGVPKSLPAMVKAYRIGEKAAAAGFDWEKKEDVWAKVKEEVGELEDEIREMDKQEPTEELKTRAEHEFGDLLCSIINAARLYGIDPELALEKCNRRFIGRFGHIEVRAEQEGKKLTELPLEKMEEWWQEAKTIQTLY